MISPTEFLSSASLYRRLRKTISQKVLICLSLSLFGLNLTFLIGIDRTETYGSCVAAAVFIHYFLLASFAWTFVEAILQYMRLGFPMLPTYCFSFW